MWDDAKKFQQDFTQQFVQVRIFFMNQKKWINVKEFHEIDYLLF